MRARTHHELALYIEHHPCGRCGTVTSDAELTLVTSPLPGGRASFVYSGHCMTCGNELRFELDCPAAWPTFDSFAYGGAEPSDLFTAGEWISMADQLTVEVSDDPGSLEPSRFYRHASALGRATAMLREAIKLDQSRRVELEARIAILQTRIDAYAPLAGTMAIRQRAELAAKPQPAVVRFGKDALEAHEQWLAHGKTGAGQLILDKGSIGGLSLGNVKLGGAHLTRFDFNRATVDFAHFEGATLAGCTAENTNFSHTNFDGATLDHCRFTGARMVLGDFKDGRITGGDFRHVNADRGAWNRIQIIDADFREAKLGDCVLDDAVLENVDLRDANLSRQSDLTLCSTVNATFRGCDLRGATFEGRRLNGTQFIDCKFAGIRGKPAIEGGYAVVRPDFSASGDGSEVRTGADVHALWGSPKL